MFRFIAILILFSSKSWASKDLPIKAAAHVNAALMATPPLPTPFQKKEWSLSIRPAYFKVSQDGNGNDSKILDYSGYGGSVFANFPLNRSVEAYGLLFGNQIKGDFVGPGPNNSMANPIYANNVVSTTSQLAFGLSYDPLAGTSYALPLFIGPSLVMTQLHETVVTTDPTNRDDFDLSMNSQSLMLYGGLQGAVRIQKHFMLGFFAVASEHLNSSDKCQSYDVTVREYGYFFDLSDPACQRGQDSGTQEVEYDLSLYSYGLTIGLPAWGFSLVVYSEVSETEYFRGVDLNMYQLTVTL